MDTISKLESTIMCHIVDSNDSPAISTMMKAISHAATNDTVEVILRTMCLLQDQGLLTTSRVSNDDFDWADMLSQVYQPATQCKSNATLPAKQSSALSFDNNFTGEVSTSDFCMDDKSGDHLNAVSFLESCSSNFSTPVSKQGTTSDVFSTPNTMFSDFDNAYGAITSQDIDQHLASINAVYDEHIQALKIALGKNPNVLHGAETHIDLITSKLCAIKKCSLPVCYSVNSPQHTDHTDGLFAMFLDEKEVSKMIGPLENKIAGLLDVLADAIKSKQGSGGKQRASQGTLATPPLTSSPRKKASPVPSASRKHRSPSSKTNAAGENRARHAVANASFSTGSPRKRARTDTLTHQVLTPHGIVPNDATPNGTNTSSTGSANMGAQGFNGSDMYQQMASAMLLGTNTTSTMATIDPFDLELDNTLLMGSDNTSALPAADLFEVNSNNALGIDDFGCSTEDSLFNMDEYLDTSMFTLSPILKPAPPAITTKPNPVTPTMTPAEMANFYTKMAAALTNSPPPPTNVDLQTHLANVLAASTNHAMPPDFYKNMVASLAADGGIGMTDAEYLARNKGALAAQGNGLGTFMGAGEDVVGAMQLAGSARGAKRARLA